MSTQVQVQKISEHNKEGIYLRCPHSCCNGRIWRYRGTMSIYAVCPNCRRAVPIGRNTVKSINKNKLTSGVQTEGQITHIIGVG